MFSLTEVCNLNDVKIKIETISIAGLQGKIALSKNSSHNKGLVIMLHGWSFNSNYMSNIFPYFLDKCHNIAFYAPDAPYICSQVENGRQCGLNLIPKRDLISLGLILMPNCQVRSLNT